MKYNLEQLKKIVNFGEEYRKIHLYQKFDTERIKKDWWEALLFFLSRAYYQGRKDIVSDKVKEIALKVIGELFTQNNRNNDFIRLKEKNWRELNTELTKVIGEGKIGKSADIKMTIDTFKFINNLSEYDNNLTTYSIGNINSGEIQFLYTSLQKRYSNNGIFSVGPKIASFYLRDLISLFNLDDRLSAIDLSYIQPIDTWVRKVCFQIELITDKNETDENIRLKIVNACKEHELSSLKFNQGAWYLGYNSFDIALRNIEKIE